MDIVFSDEEIPDRVCTIPVSGGELESNLGQNPRPYFLGGSLDPSKYVLYAKVTTACDSYVDWFVEECKTGSCTFYRGVGEDSWVRHHLNLKEGNNSPIIQVPKGVHFTVELVYMEPCNSGCYDPDINGGNPYRGRFKAAIASFQRDEGFSFSFILQFEDNITATGSCD